MEPLIDMRVSRVGPVVEDNLVELVDLVKQMGRKGDLTESQNRRMVGYMGNLDEMRSQIVIMVQRYEDDSKVLKRLLDLVDRIDDVRLLAIKAESSQGNEDKVSLESDKEIARQYDTPFNPLLVSAINILDVSGLFASNLHETHLVEEEEEEEEAGDEYWDHDDDPSALATADDTPKDTSSINLSVSNLYLPNLFDEPSNGSKLTVSATLVPTTTTTTSSSGPLSASTSILPSSSSPMLSPVVPSAPPPPPSIDRKGKGKAKVEVEVKKPRGAAAQRAQMLNDIKRWKLDSSDSDSSESEASDEEEVNGAGSSRPVTIGASKWRKTYPAGSSSARKPSTSSSSGSGSEDSETDSETDSSSSPPPPPPMPPSKRNNAARKQRKGPCEPTLCKICYDEYTSWDKLYELRPCGHCYCRECWQDHLTTNINDGAVLDLTCPFPDCESEILPSDVKTLCSAETIAKYERFTVLAALRADPNARWCPNVYCNNGIKHNPATMPWVFCSACKFEFCFHCMAERHDGAECGQEALVYLKKKRESEAAALEKFSEWTDTMKALVKPCPGCKNFIEKNDGCNHMTCGNQTCRTQFCWLCLNLYNGDHFSDAINFPDCYEKQYWTPPNQQANIYVPPHTPRTRRFANIARKVGMYVGVGVAVVTLGVPAAVIGGPVYGCFQLHKRLKARRRERRRASRSYHSDEPYVPPSPARIAEAAREARRLYDLEHS